MVGSLVIRTRSNGRVTIFEYERGLCYVHGKFRKLLGPGSHRIWPFSGQRITVVDTRQTSLNVVGQKMFSSDPLPVTVNFTVDFRLVDPVKALHESQNALQNLYEHVQREGRSAISQATIQQLLSGREAMHAELKERLLPYGSLLGLEILAAEVKDLILVASVRELISAEAEQRIRAQAALSAAREEIATLRAMANAARLVRDHPEILKLRELEVMTEFSRRQGNTLVWNSGGSLSSLPLDRPATTPADGET